MTADRLPRELRDSGSGGGGDHAAELPLATILAMCDQALGEIGRRRHMFSWLRAPEEGPEGWLPVDAYYPGNRLVVMYRSRPGPHDQLQRELVPGHGLRLLAITSEQLGEDPARARGVLAQMLAELGPVRRAAEEPPPRPRRLRLPRPASRADPASRARAPVPTAQSGTARDPGSSSAPRPQPPSQASPGPRSAAVARAARYVESRRNAARAIGGAREGEPENWWFGSPSRETLAVVALVIAAILLIVLVAQLLGV